MNAKDYTTVQLVQQKVHLIAIVKVHIMLGLYKTALCTADFTDEGFEQ